MFDGPITFYNAALEHTSSWANTYLDRDHHAPPKAQAPPADRPETPKPAGLAPEGPAPRNQKPDEPSTPRD